MAWQYDPIGAGWITGTTPALADFQHIEDDIQTWGGNVNAGGHQLTNCAGVLGSGGASLYFNGTSVGIGTASPATKLHVDGGALTLSNAGATTSKLLMFGGSDGGNSSSIYIIDGSANYQFYALSTGLVYCANNVGLGVTSPPASAAKSLSIAVGTAPTANPSSGHCIYVDPADNKLKARGSSGTITVLAVP